MAWGRIDDKLYSHRKTMRIPRAHRCEAVGLWTLANSWCNNHGTSGRVPRDIVDEFGSSPEIAELLVVAGYWIVTEDGWEFANWGEYNLSGDDLDAKRAAETERKRRWREAKKAKSEQVSEDCPEDVPAGQRDMSRDVPDGDAVSPLTHTHTHTQENSSKKSSHPPTPQPRTALAVVPAKAGGGRQVAERLNGTARSAAAHKIAVAFSDSLPTPIESGVLTQVGVAIDKCLTDGIPPPAIAAGLQAWTVSDSWSPTQIPHFVHKANARGRPGRSKPTEKALDAHAAADELLREVKTLGDRSK